MEMMYYQLSRFSYQDSLKILEADIQYANSICLNFRSSKRLCYWDFKLLRFQRPRVVYADGRSKISTHGRKATIREFYGVILPSLQRLHGCMGELDDDKEMQFTIESSGKKRLGHIDWEREDECGICLEPCTKMVLPNCSRAMCIKCYRNWNTKSESCPFCRGSLKRVDSEDLWVLTCDDDVVDNETVSKEDLLRFYLYVNSLPKDCSDALFLVYYKYLI